MFIPAFSRPSAFPKQFAHTNQDRRVKQDTQNADEPQQGVLARTDWTDISRLYAFLKLRSH
jgi:hypothetical protein